MKTEEQFLLNYMYQKGYTDEDMFDEENLQRVRYSAGFLIFKIKPAVTRAIGVIVNAFKKMSEIIKTVWTEITARLESAPVYSKTQERSGYINFSIPPTDFRKRPVIRDQVIDRKPNYLVRKIIH